MPSSPTRRSMTIEGFPTTHWRFLKKERMTVVCAVHARRKKVEQYLHRLWCWRLWRNLRRLWLWRQGFRLWLESTHTTVNKLIKSCCQHACVITVRICTKYLCDCNCGSLTTISASRNNQFTKTDKMKAVSKTVMYELHLVFWPVASPRCAGRLLGHCKFYLSLIFSRSLQWSTLKWPWDS